MADFYCRVLKTAAELAFLFHVWFWKYHSTKTTIGQFQTHRRACIGSYMYPAVLQWSDKAEAVNGHSRFQLKGFPDQRKECLLAKNAIT
jgi:hypothetical protein